MKLRRKVIQIPNAEEPEGIRVLWVKEIDADTTRELASDLAIIRQNKQRVCPVVIDSPGGEVYSLLAMMDLLDSYDGIVVTIALGRTMSCGAALFTCGTQGYRFVAPSATLMLHDVSSGSEGKIEEQKVSVKEDDRLNSIVWKRMADNIGKPPSYLLDTVRERGHTDWYLNARNAVKMGIADHVGIPIFEEIRRIDPLLGIVARDSD